MQISESLRHEAGAMRVRYLRGLLIGGGCAVSALFRALGRFLKRGNTDQIRSGPARI
jgi:hypothetical protein